MSQLGTYNFAAIETLTGNVGGAVYQTASNINIFGAGGINTVGVPATSTITITGPAGAAGGIVARFTTDIGGPIDPTAGGIVDLDGGANITTDGSVPNRVTFNVSGTTNHAVQIGNAGGSLTSMAVGATGETIMGATGADPAWTNSPSFGGSVTAATDITATNGDVTIGNTDAAATAGILYYKKSRAGATIVTGDSLGQVKFSGHEGTGYIDGARITSTNSGTVALNRVAGDLKFYTHPDSAAADPTLRMTIDTTGAITIATPDAGTGLTVSGGGLTVTAGTVTVTAGNVALPVTNAAGTQGVITLGGNRWVHNLGTNNSFVGESSGNMALTVGTTTDNTAVGYHTMMAIDGALRNVGVGSTALVALTDGDDNTAIGSSALVLATTGSKNTAVGSSALSAITTGTDNIAIGYGAGISATVASSSNIYIGSLGAAESNTIRIGTQGGGAGAQDKTYIVGVYNTAVGATAGVVLADNAHKVGALSGAANTVLIGGTAPTFTASPTLTTITATTFQTGDPGAAASCVTLSGTTLLATGTDADVGISITSKGASSVTINKLLLTNDLAVSEGGTGASTFTQYGVLIGNAANAIQVTAAGTTGQILRATTGANPGWSTATYPDTVAIGDVLVASGANVIGVAAGAATAGYVLMANGAGSAPTFQAPPPMTWSIKTADLDPMVINNGYIANKAGLLTFTLPATSVVGAVLRVTGMNTAVGWRIAQRANQIIHWSNTLVTTTGAGGYLESTDKYDAVEIVCSVADLEWVVLSSKGNITIA